MSTDGLPHNLDAERAVLGAAMLNPDTARQAFTFLKPSDFFLASHGKVFAAIANLAEGNQPADLISIVEQLRQSGDLEAAGGAAYVASLLDGIPRLLNVSSSIELIEEKSRLRALAKVGEAITIAACHGGADLESVRAQVLAQLDGCAAQHRSGVLRITKWDDIPTAVDLPDDHVTWLVDRVIPRAGIVLLTGLPGRYKTWLGLILARSIAAGRPFLGRDCQQADVLYLDLENPVALIRERCELLGLTSLQTFRIWGGWQEDPPPSIGDTRLRDLASTRKPLIIFDSLIRFAGYEDENAAGDLAPVLAELRRLTHAGAAVLLIHHPPKDERSLYRGSGDILAGVDVAYSIRCKDDDDLLHFQCFKSRFGQQVSLILRPNLGEAADFDVYETPAAHREHKELERLRQVIADEPGLTKTEVIRRSQLPSRRAGMLLAGGVGRYWQKVSGEHNAHRFFPLQAGPEPGIPA